MRCRSGKARWRTKKKNTKKDDITLSRARGRLTAAEASGGAHVMFEIARAQGNMRRISSRARELSLARLIVRPAIREKDICGTSDVGWRPSCRPTANRPCLRHRIQKRSEAGQEWETADAPCFQRVIPLLSLCYLLLKKLSKSLTPLSDCPFVLNRLPVFLGNLPVSWKKKQGNPSPCCWRATMSVLRNLAIAVDDPVGPFTRPTRAQTGATMT